MTDQTTTPAVHAMQDEWPNGVTPCCGARSADMPEWTRWTTVPAAITCPTVAGHPDLLAAKAQAGTETTTPDPVAKIRAFIVESVGEDMGPEMTRQAERLADRLGLLNEEGAKSVAPEPKWLTSLRRDMHTEIADIFGPLAGISAPLPDQIADRATGLAASYLHPLHAKVAELEEVIVAGPSKLGMAKRIIAGFGGYVEDDDDENPASAPEVREVPAGEAREGDVVTRAGVVAGVGTEGFSVRWDDGDLVTEWFRGNANGPRLSRPVSPLPDQPGAVGTATVRGIPDAPVFRVYSDTEADHRAWVTTGGSVLGGAVWLRNDEVCGFKPAGAGVTEGGIR